MIKQTINLGYTNTDEKTKNEIKLDQIVGSGNRSIFTGVDDEMNKYLDPIVTGYAFIYWVKLPFWFEQDPDLKYFKEFSQTNFRSFQGVEPIELETVTQQTGFNGNEQNAVGGIQRGNTTFSIGHKEYSGSPMTKMYRKWISLIRDPRTGIAAYPKLYNCDYGARNHTGQLLYVMTRPDVTNTQSNIVEYAAFYSNVFPTNIPNDTLYNFELGNQDSPTIDIQFRGFPEIGPAVDSFAEKVLKEKIVSNESNDSGIPFLDSFNTNDAVRKILDNSNWGGSSNSDTNILKAIYEEKESNN